MEIQVALIDNNDIIQKMLSHCLHYFSVKVFRFQSLEESLSHFTVKKPDIVFVDADMKKGQELLALSVTKSFQPVPVVLIYRADRLASLPADIPHKLQKPLNPEVVRKIVMKLVPKAKESKVHPFLKFPKKEKRMEELAFDMRREEKTDKIISPASHPGPEKGLQMQALNPSEKTKEAPPTDIPLSSSELSLPGLSNVPSFSDSQKKESKKGLADFSANPSSPLSPQKKPLNSLSQKKEKTSLKKTEERKFNIDENTQNDLAPMAIKSSSPVEASEEGVQNLKLSEKDIVAVLNKYKDTIEFQEVIERVLKEYAKDTVTAILKDSKNTDVMQKSLETFKDSAPFKKMVEAQVAQYVQKQLPKLIKEIVLKEIKDIVES